MILFEQNILGALLRIGIVLGTVFGVFVYILVWAERKISAAIQDRIGPNRVGPAGLLQGVADGIKFVFKEDIRPDNASTFLYLLAPLAAMFPAVMVLAAVPVGGRMIEGNFVPLVIANIDMGILFILAISSLSVFSILIGGWASNSKYPVLGGLRAAAQTISYEIPLGLSIMSVLLWQGLFA